MAANSNIEWTNATWNPMRGCSRVSTECVNCYAEDIAHRFSGPGKPYEGLIAANGSWNGKIKLAPEHLLDPIRWIKGRRVFVNSMTDLFHENVPFEYIAQVFAVMACTTRHTYQVLTKRPARALEFFNWLTPEGDDEGTMEEYAQHGWHFWPQQVQPTQVYPEWKPHREGKCGGYDNCGPGWPLVNVEFGVSCGNQEAADERIPLLLKIPAAKRFLSCEPLLGPINFRWQPYAHQSTDETYRDYLERVGSVSEYEALAQIDLVIVGGESGPNARACDVGWIRSIVSQCKSAGVAVFVKQLGAHPTWDGCSCPDEHWPSGTQKEDRGNGRWEMRLRDRKGGDIQEWPADLRVRQFPGGAA